MIRRLPGTQAARIVVSPQPPSSVGAHYRLLFAYRMCAGAAQPPPASPSQQQPSAAAAAPLASDATSATVEGGQAGSSTGAVATSAGAAVTRGVGSHSTDVAPRKKLWFHGVTKRVQHDSAVEQWHETLLNPEDPKAPTPPSMAPMPQVGQPRAGLVVEGPKWPTPPPIEPLPLTLVEEVPPPPMVLSEMELLMKAWSEEYARHYFILMLAIRTAIALGFFGILYFYYRTAIAIERRLRGGEHQPENLRIGSVVYFDFSENHKPLGRVVIGLLNENCPLYCEYFHRRCTGSGGESNPSFRGSRLSCLFPFGVAIFGEGRMMKHEVPGYNPHYLPTEWVPTGPWRGCLSSMAYAPNRESPNFAVHISSGDFTPQVFGLVLSGFEVFERMSAMGVTHGSESKRAYIIEGCGELCTLDKAIVVPMPWRLYESVSVGYDEDKFGPKSDPRVRETYNILTPAQAEMVRKASAAVPSGASGSGAPWYRRWFGLGGSPVAPAVTIPKGGSVINLA
jgi:peptidylprolyl isomerase